MCLCVHVPQLVVLAGLIWNPPTSCAWAARVLVNDRQARDHGLRHVGLPSRLARFQWLPSTTSVASRPAGKATPAPAPQTSWRGQGHGEGSSAAGTGSSSSSEGGSSRLVKSGTLQIHNVDNIRGRSLRGPLCTLMLPPGGPPKWGPKINLKLPSFR